MTASWITDSVSSLPFLFALHLSRPFAYLALLCRWSSIPLSISFYLFILWPLFFLCDLTICLSVPLYLVLVLGPQCCFPFFYFFYHFGSSSPLLPSPLPLLLLPPFLVPFQSLPLYFSAPWTFSQILHVPTSLCLLKPLPSKPGLYPLTP